MTSADSGVGATRARRAASGPMVDEAGSGTVTVVLGVFNGARHLQEQLDSVLAQSRPPDEMIIADDGSVDASAEVADAFAAAAPFPVVVRRNPHIGIRRNFLEAAAQATSQWIAWCDADDVWVPHKLETCMRALRQSGAVLAFHDVTIVSEELEPMPPGSIASWSADIRRDALVPRFAGRQWECFNGFATVFRSDLLQGVVAQTLPDAWAHHGAWYHDEAVHELARLSGSRVIIADRLASYRQHSGSITGDGARPGLSGRLSVGRQQYLDRYRSARSMQRWAERVPSLAGDPEIRRHLRRVVRDQRLRLGVYAGRSIPRKVVSLLAGVVASSYRPRSRGGHGAVGLAKDLLVSVRR